MKRLLLSCILFLFTIVSYAETCPKPPSDYIFRVAAWGNHTDITSQISCYYYDRLDQRKEKKIVTSEWYSERDIQLLHWRRFGEHYYQCWGTNVNDCSFKHG